MTLRRGGPEGGATTPLITVSSSPRSRKVQCVGLSVSAAFASVLAQIPWPVMYMTRPGSNGSMSMSPIQPRPMGSVVARCQ